MILALALGIASLHISGQTPEWAHRFDSTGQALVNAVALDRGNGVFITGYFTGTNLTFGSNVLTNSGNTALLIGKLDAAGQPLWAISPTGFWAYGLALATDASGSVLVAGAFSETLALGTNTLVSHNANYADLFLARFGPTGEVHWATSAAGSLRELPYALAADAAGNAYMCGEFYSPTLDFGSVVLTNANQGAGERTDAFVAKYDTAGNLIWARRFGGIEDDRGYGIGVDDTGCAYLTGVFWSPTIQFGDTTLTNSSGGDFFIAKLDANGLSLWARSGQSTKLPGVSADDIGFSLAVGPANGIHVTGSFHENFRLGEIALAGFCCGPTPFVAHYTTGGDLLWAKAPEVPDIYGVAVAITADAENSSYITGYFGGTPTFGAWRISSFTGAGFDPFIVKYDAQGRAQWATAFGGQDDDRGHAVAVNPLGHVFVGGWLTSTNAAMTGSSTNLNLAGNPQSQLFLAKFAPPIIPSGSPAADSYRLSISGAAGRALTVQAGTNLASWTTRTNFTGTGLTETLLLPRRTDGRGEFFRVTSP